MLILFGLSAFWGGLIQLTLSAPFGVFCLFAKCDIQGSCVNVIGANVGFDGLPEGIAIARWAANGATSDQG